MAAKSKTKKKSVERKFVKRETRRYQLRLEHPIDSHVREVLEYARTQKREVTMIRDGVRLLWALENNDLSVLFQMFPNLKPEIRGGEKGIEEIKQMLQIIADHQTQPVNSGPKALAAPSFAMPVFEDDEPTVLIRTSTNQESAMNFVTALRSMQ